VRERERRERGERKSERASKREREREREEREKKRDRREEGGREGGREGERETKKEGAGGERARSRASRSRLLPTHHNIRQSDIESGGLRLLRKLLEGIRDLLRGQYRPTTEAT